MSNATDELRRMLDERGVKYETDDTQVSDTEWYYVTKLRDGYRDRWTYEEPPECGLLLSYQYDLSAEDAIEATLGPGTCTMVVDNHYRVDKITTSWGCVCSACGGFHQYTHGDGWAYCPSCGRQVIGG